MGCEKTADKLFNKVVLIATFLGITTLLFWALTPVIQTGTIANDPSMDWSKIGITDYAYYDESPFEVTNASVVDHRESDNYAEKFTSAIPHRHDIRAWVIRDNFWYFPEAGSTDKWTMYRDYLGFQMNLESLPTLPYTSKTAAISFETIVEKANFDNNTSEIDFTLNANYILFINTGPGMLISDGLWMNEFNMSIGWSLNLSAAASTSPWALVGQIMTFSVPNVNWYVSVLIGVPLDMMIGFIIIAIITRFIPTIPGL